MLFFLVCWCTLALLVLRLAAPAAGTGTGAAAGSGAAAAAAAAAAAVPAAAAMHTQSEGILSAVIVISSHSSFHFRVETESKRQAPVQTDRGCKQRDGM